MTTCKKKVRFQMKPIIYNIISWGFAYRQARRGCWEMYALDRLRFRERINRLSNVLNIVLDKKFRERIYNERFL